MRDFLVSNLFSVWVLCCAVLIPRFTRRPLVAAAFVILSGVLVLVALRELGYGGFLAGGWVMYGPMVLIVAVVVVWQLRRAKRGNGHDRVG